MKHPIHILNASSLNGAALDEVSDRISHSFSVRVDWEPATFDFQKAFDSARRQFSSGILLGQLLAANAANSTKAIAVVDVDLYVPVLTFVFGEAQLNGPASIVSVHRLANQFYGLPGSDRILLNRLVKEAAHELGHNFGLLHCHEFECVMRSSTYVEEIDLKKEEFCPACRNLLGSH